MAQVGHRQDAGTEVATGSALRNLQSDITGERGKGGHGMSQRARIGVIGAGWWAAVNHLPVLKANKDCEIVAVNRLGASELAELQRKFEVALGFEDYRAMLDEVPMDGVVISSPHVLHHEHALAALAKGCHLLVEKPLATTAADARDLVARPTPQASR